jgi:alpha-L-rhamnosidase
VLSKAARVLGKEADAALYARLSEEVRAALVREYFTPTGRLAVPTQTAYTLALFMDIPPAEWRARTAYALRLKIKEAGCRLRTGFIGTPYLCRVLSATGSNDLAYRLLLREEYPGWLYAVKLGATTIWERWNSVLPDGRVSDTGMNSLNHYAYGSVVEWLYQDAAGIQPLEAFPGFRRFRLAPQPHPSLGSLRAEFASPMGRIKSAWQYTDGVLEFSFTVPLGATAELLLPQQPPVELGPGEHTFRQQGAAPRFHLDTPLCEIFARPEAAAALRQALPDLTGMMLFEMLAGEKSLRDFERAGYLRWTEGEREALEGVLLKIGASI